jgi:peptidoglycan DL-endopeptidase LytE
MKFKNSIPRFVFFSAIILISSLVIFSQGRVRVVTNEKTETPETTNEEVLETPKYVLASPVVEKRIPLNQKIVVVGSQKEASKEKVRPFNTPSNLSFANFNQRLQQAIDSKIGIPYRYGSTGPNTFDCSGLVWSVFQSAGQEFERTSASNYWQKFEPVSGDEKYKFGTLVFFNNLGHMGIVANEDGFYHASSSKGVTYSPFAGYWGKRVVGFRRIPLNAD